MSRMTRYQGAVIRDHHILLIKQLEHSSGRSYWLLPGGRIEPGETEHDCVQREVQEETYLHVQVKYLLLDESGISGRSYDHRKTYLCNVLDGEAQPGSEPEIELATEYTFTEVGWFDLRDHTAWNEAIVCNSITYPLLQQIRAALGYVVPE